MSSVSFQLDSNVEHHSSHAAFLGRACELAYLPAEQGAVEFRKQLNLDAKLISVSNTQAYVATDSNSIVIAFRGSESFMTLDGFRDWLLTNARNFLILPEGEIGTDFAAAGVGARFHSGFMTALHDIWNPLIQAVEAEFSKCERPVWVTGHSLGGAIALLCGWRLHQHFINVHQICTFGAPMIGNEAAATAFKREFPNKIFRYVDVGDIVPKLPTISLFSNAYQHCQQEILIGNAKSGTSDEKMQACVQEGVDDSISPEIEKNLWDEIRNGMPSHMMDNYLTRVMGDRQA